MKGGEILASTTIPAGMVDTTMSSTLRFRLKRQVVRSATPRFLFATHRPMRRAWRKWADSFWMRRP